jgi:hypothetical protein
MTAKEARELVKGLNGSQARIALVAILQGKSPQEAIAIAKTYE